MRLTRGRHGILGRRRGNFGGKQYGAKAARRHKRIKKAIIFSHRRTDCSNSDKSN